MAHATLDGAKGCSGLLPQIPSNCRHQILRCPLGWLSWGGDGVLVAVAKRREASRRGNTRKITASSLGTVPRLGEASGSLMYSRMGFGHVALDYAINM